MVDTPVRRRPSGVRRNMRAPERELDILDKAVGFFAEHGFEGQTRELAKTIGISHSAIYRHFPTKDALIERVYEHVFLSRWKPEWELLVIDRSRDLNERLIRFYLGYAEQIFDHDWVRIFMFSGLRSYDLTTRYLALVSDRVIRPIAGEMRIAFGLPSAEQIPLAEREIEAAWGLHGRIFYLAIRRHVYGMAIPNRLEDVIADAVDGTIAGARPIVERIVRDLAQTG